MIVRDLSLNSGMRSSLAGRQPIKRISWVSSPCGPNLACMMSPIGSEAGGAAAGLPPRSRRQAGLHADLHRIASVAVSGGMAARLPIGLPFAGGLVLLKYTGGAIKY